MNSAVKIPSYIMRAQFLFSESFFIFANGRLWKAQTICRLDFGQFEFEGNTILVKGTLIKICKFCRF